MAIKTIRVFQEFTSAGYVPMPIAGNIDYGVTIAGTFPGTTPTTFQTDDPDIDVTLTATTDYYVWIRSNGTDWNPMFTRNVRVYPDSPLVNNVVMGIIIANLSNTVPYVGATTNVDLGTYGLKADYLQLNTSPTSTPTTQGTIAWNALDGTADLRLTNAGLSLKVGQDSVAKVVNGTSSNLLKADYKVVKIIGAQGQRLQIGLALADNDYNSKDTIGLVAENINNNQEGFIITSGIIDDIDTTGTLQGEIWNDGDTLYLSGTTLGKITNIKPQAPTHTIILGFVVYAHANHGKIFVKVDNGYEIDELHNVKITSVANKNILVYETATSLWKNRNIFGTQGYVPYYDDTLLMKNSPIFTDGTQVIIGDNEEFSVGNKLSVVGNIAVHKDYGYHSGLYQILFRQDATGEFRIGTNAANDYTTFYANGIERVRISPSGFLAIGLTNPTSILHVKGTTAYTNAIIDNNSASGGGYYSAYQNGAEKAIFGVSGAWLLDNSSNAALIAKGVGQGIQFYTNGSTSEKMGINSDGNVFVGQTPTYVAGATQLVVRGKTGAGYLGVNHYDMSIKGGMNTFNSVFQVGTSTYHSMAFLVEDIERGRVNSSGRLLWGTPTDNNTDLVQINGSLIASSLKKSGGLSTQFLKADGSIDDLTYVTSSSLSSYLPLVGGTMSGGVTFSLANTYTPLRFTGGVADYTIAEQDGTGRVNWYWNKSGSGTSPTFQVSSEDAVRFKFSTAQAAGGESGIGVYYAPANTAGASISWTEIMGAFHNGFRVSPAAIFSSSVTASSFIGAGTGLTGTASGLSIGGNASTATTATTATTAGSLTSMNISQFTNNSGYITSSASISGSSASAPLLTSSGGLTTQYGNGTIGYASAIAYTTTGLFPAGDNSNSILTLNRHPDNYYSQLGFSSNGNMYYRSFSATAINTTTPWRTIWDSGTLTNLNQLTNGPGYITGYTETDTLATVTGRGASTSTPITLNAELTIQTNTSTGIRLTSTNGNQSLWIRTGYDSDGTATPLVSATNVVFQSSGNSGGTFSFVSGNTKVLSIGGAINSLVSLQQSGNQVLHAGNYTSYSPSLTGLGANGTWGINISGNATSSTTATTASNLSNFTNQSGARYSTDFNSIVSTGFFNAEGLPTNVPGTSGFGQLISSKGIDTGLQIYGGYVNDNLWFRGWSDYGTFTAWRTILHSGNYSSYALPLTGGTLSGQLIAPSVKLSTSTNNAFLTGASDWGVRFSNDSGYIQVGPANTAYAHIYTDRAQFYLNKDILINGTQVVVNSGTWAINISGNASTSTNLSNTQSNWASVGGFTNVVGMLSWRNYGNGHVIFDASAGNSPSNTSVNNTNSQIAWASTYPTLMGWNGTNTYGLRVDTARFAETATTATSATTATNSTQLGGADSSRFVLGGSGSRRGVNQITDWNQSTLPDVAFLSSESSITNAPTADFTYGVQTSFHRSGPDYRTQFVTSLYGNNSYWLRQLRDSAGWSSWVQVLHSGNYNSYSPQLNGTGATGTWGISVSGSAGSVAWTNVSGRPTAVSSFTNDSGYVVGGSSPTFTEVYANNWFRNNGVNEGLYNESTTQHWSSGANGWWDASSTTSFSGIRMYTGSHLGTLRGSFYADNNNWIGILSNDQNWALRIDSSKNAQVYGDLTVGNGTNSNIYMVDTDENTRRIHTNSGRIGFLTTSNGWGLYCDNAGLAYANGGNRLVENTGTWSISISGNAATAYNWSNTPDSWYGIGQSTSASGATAVGGYYPWTLSYHTGLALSAHSSYGGIRFYNQNYPSGPLASAPTMQIVNNDVLINGYSAVNSQRTLTINGTTYDLSANRSWTVSTSGGIAGSGTTGTLARWDSGSSLNSSIIYDNGSTVTIGNSVSMYKLSVNPISNSIFGIGYTGTNQIFVNAVDTGFTAIPIVYNALSHTWLIGFGTAMTLTSSLDLLIGTSTGVSGGGKLQVNGDVNINGSFKINGTVIGGGGGSGISGSGTANMIPKWTGGTSLSDSAIYDNGAFSIGIGTTSVSLPSGRSGLVVRTSSFGGSAEILIQQSSNANGTSDGFAIANIYNDGAAIYNRANLHLRFGTNNIERMRLTEDGNLGFGYNAGFGAGVKVIGIGNATTVPTTNPSNAGILWVENGALRYRGSNGTVTTIAIA